MNTIHIQRIDTECYFKVKVVPASSRTVIVGVLDGMLKMRVTAAPEKGKANQSVIKFLAKKLGINKQAVTITAGLANPIKKICITGLAHNDILERLNV
jgi:uncharacterized protein